ncbi:MAG: molybdenum cofactor guanylyltransferase [Chthoniobacteraceae bacterium]
MSSTQNLQFTAALMMGGQSRRMGRDKAELEIGGVPLWRRQLTVLRESGAAEVVVSATVDRAGKTGDYPLVVDEVEGQGPLRAIATVLRHSHHDGVLVLGVDLPRMTSEFLREIATIGLARNIAVIPEAANRLQPLAAYYSRACLPLLDEQLLRGDLALHRFISHAASDGLAIVHPVASAEWRLFTNLNTPEDVAVYRQEGEC